MNTPTIATEERRRIKEAARSHMMHEGIVHVLQFFHYKHLPDELADVSERFYQLAWATAMASNNPETTVALRKLLEAKDAAVRASLPE